MRIVTALDGNALLRRGVPLTAASQRENARIACAQLARIISGNEVVIAHGNGPPGPEHGWNAHRPVGTGNRVSLSDDSTRCSTVAGCCTP